jgi:hypothetical protein
LIAEEVHHPRRGIVGLLRQAVVEDLVIPKDKTYGWIIVDDPRGNRNRIYVKTASAYKTGDALSFRVLKGSRGVYADDIAPAVQQDDAA